MFDSALVYQQLAAFGPDQPETWRHQCNEQTLCDRCQKIDWEPALLYLPVADEYSFYPRVSLFDPTRRLGELRDAAHSGCHLCTLILSCLLTMRYRYSAQVDPLPEGLHGILDDTAIEITVEAMAKRPPVWLTVSIGDQGPVWGWQDFSLPIISDLPPQSSRMATQEASDIAAQWLADCMLKHDPCSSDMPQLPHRIINVSNDVLRLEEPDGRLGLYATLSYSIGGAHLFTTTSKDIDQRKRGFSIDRLPKTAQDAVWWTRKLGLEYLWLDSLCILQDNLGDWEIELSSMATIYQNATVTIAATKATTATEGCLPNLSKLNMVPCRPTDGIVVLPDYGRLSWIFSKGALDTRAWCFQEVQLSTRVLRVGGEELAWQCRACKRLQSEPARELVHNIEANMVFFGSGALDDSFKAGARPFKLWYSLVQNFGRRNLSFPADKLPAFSGMASVFSKVLDATYVAGLWQEDLFRGLCWRMTDPGGVVAYRAPTWSWASVEGGFLGWAVWFYDREDFVVDLLDVSVEVSGLNPYGRTTSGRLTLSGSLAPVPSFFYEDESDFGPVDWRRFLLTWDRRGVPAIGCVLLRLHEIGCMVLEPIRGRSGAWTRVGFLMAAFEPRSKEKAALTLTLELLNSFEWRCEVVKIL